MSALHLPTGFHSDFPTNGEQIVRIVKTLRIFKLLRLLKTFRVLRR
jgi:hypothetical protein